jgi:TRAP-type C4-dicarboxylate transport system permease small subunit
MIFVWKAVEFTLSMAKQVAPSTQMSMAVPYSSAIVGGILMLYYVLRNWWFDIRDKEGVNKAEP